MTMMDSTSPLSQPNITLRSTLVCDRRSYYLRLDVLASANEFDTCTEQDRNTEMKIDFYFFVQAANHTTASSAECIYHSIGNVKIQPKKPKKEHIIQHQETKKPNGLSQNHQSKLEECQKKASTHRAHMQMQVVLFRSRAVRFASLSDE